MQTAADFLKNYKGVDDDNRSDWYERETVIQAMEDYAALIAAKPHVSRRSEQVCLHPREHRSYIGEGYLRCNICGEEMR